MQVKSITIEGMRSVSKKTYTLDNITYLYGRNGAGKSTVIKALQWALLGYIPGTGKRNTDIFSHVNGRSMGVSIVLSDNENTYKISRYLTKQKSNITSEIITEPEDLDIEHLLGNITLPVFNFTDFTNLSANQIKDWFISFLPKENIEIDWETIFTNVTNSIEVPDTCIVNELIQKAKSCTNIKDVNNYIKQMLSIKRAERAQLDGAIKTLIFYDDVDPDTDISELQTKIVELNQTKDTALVNQTACKHNQDILSRLTCYSNLAESAEHDKDIENWKIELTAAEVKLQEVSKLLNDLRTDRYVSYEKLIELQTFVKANGVCQYTNEVCSSIKNLVDERSKEIPIMESKISDIDSRLQELVSENTRLSKLCEFLKSQIQARENDYVQRDSLKHSVGLAVDESYLDINLHKLVDQISELNESINKCLANQRFQAAADEFTKQGFIIDQSIVFLKECDKLTGPNGIQCDTLDDPFEKFSESVNKYIKVFFGDTASIKFNNIKVANSFNFGLSIDDSYVPYTMLSSGEQCLFAFSLMLAIIDNSNSTIKLLLIDDAIDHLDDDNAKKFFEALHGIKDIQIVMAGVKFCNESYAREVQL